MIGKNILEIRKRNGLTLSKLADKAGISKSYLSNIERNLNKNPSIAVLRKISGVLDVELDLLLNSDPKIIKQQNQDQEWLDFAHELKESGIKKEQLKEYKTIIQFIKWQKLNSKSRNKDE